MPHEISLGADLMVVIANALGVDGQKCRRVIVDAPYNGPITVYIEQLGDKRLFEIDWAGHLKDVQITSVNKSQEGS